MESIALLNNLLPEENRLPTIGALTKPGQTGRWFITVLKFCILGAGVGIVALAVTAQFIFIAPCGTVLVVSLISLHYVRKLGKLESEAAVITDLNSLSEKISNFVLSLNNQVHQLGEGNHRFEEEIENYKRVVEEGSNKVREQLVQIEQVSKELQIAESQIEEYEKINEKLHDGVVHLQEIVERFVQTGDDFSHHVDNLGEERKKIETHVDELDSEVDEMNGENEELVEGVSKLTDQVDKIEKMLQLVDGRFSELQKLKEQKESELEKLNQNGEKLLKAEEKYRENLELQKKLSVEMQKKIELLEEKAKKRKELKEIDKFINNTEKHPSQQEKQEIDQAGHVLFSLEKPKKNSFQIFHHKKKEEDPSSSQHKHLSSLDGNKIEHEEEKSHFLDKILHFGKNKKKEEIQSATPLSPKKIKKKKKEEKKEEINGNNN